MLDFGTTAKELKESLLQNSKDNIHGFNFLNIDVRSLNSTGPYNVSLLAAPSSTTIIDTTGFVVTSVEQIDLGDTQTLARRVYFLDHHEFHKRWQNED